MIQESITTHSNNIVNSYSQFILDYPMGSYIPSWKIFRAFSKENHIIARHIDSTKTWKHSQKNTIMDIGGGDGLVLKNLIDLQGYLSKVKFIEPNEQLLNEAERNLDLGKNLTLINKDLFTLDFNKDFKNVDIILLVHVLYLLELKSLTKLIDYIPRGVPIIIVTDETNSLFADCWKFTAKKYANRSRNIHIEIADLENSNKIKVHKSSFKTYLKNPFNIERDDIFESLLSMITYSEYSALSKDTKINIKSIFDKYSEKDLVHCNSVCYEIIKF